MPCCKQNSCRVKPLSRHWRTRVNMYSLRSLISIIFGRKAKDDHLNRKYAVGRADTFRTHRIGYSPAHDLAAVNIDDGKHVHEPTEHGYVGNIRLPDLVCAVDFQVPEQIGEFIISLIGLAEILFGVDGLQVHDLI